jgi:tetratricopeptide (TPR) repeat protein
MNMATLSQVDSAPLAGGARAARQLVLEEYEAICEAGQVSALSFLEQHPKLASQRTIVVDLAYEEYCQRVSAGETIDTAQFSGRFGVHASVVARQINLHQFLVEHPDLAQQCEEAHWPIPGDELLGFVVRDELGRGTLGRVYLASEAALGNRLVALKVAMHGAEEAETLGRLRHRNIVPVYSTQYDVETNLAAICMPYLGTATLSDLLGPLFARSNLPRHAREILDAVCDTDLHGVAPGDRHPVDRELQHGTYVDGVLHLGVQIADALAFAHANEVFHGDLKPSNVLITPDGRPILLDFNLSFDLQRTQRLVGGTVAYMAPEQIGVSDDGCHVASGLDARTDLFSLGALLYELLSGVLPFGGLDGVPLKRQREYMQEQHRRGLRPLRSINPYVDARTAAIVEQLLSLSVADRPRSADEVACSLRDALSTSHQVRRWVRLHRWAASGGAAVLCAAAAVTMHRLAMRDPYSVRQLNRGREAYRSGQYAEAVQYLTRATAADPTSADAFYLRGRAHQKAGELELAMANYREAKNLGADGRTLACLGYCAGQLRDHRTAIDAVLGAIESGLVTAEVFNNLGYGYLRQRWLDDARRCFDQALALNPVLQAARYNRAMLELESSLKGSVSESAFADIEQAVAIGPATGELHWNAARLYATAARRDPQLVPLAIRHARHAIEYGHDPRRLVQAAEFSTLATDPEFVSLASLPISHVSPQPVVRLVDPVDD